MKIKWTIIHVLFQSVNDYHGNRRGGDSRRDGPRREGNDYKQREETKEIRRERQVYTKEPEERMPKFKVSISSGPVRFFL